MPSRLTSKLIVGGILALLALIVFFGTYFTVGQNEMAVVTRFGELQYVAGPGLHFKVPLVMDTEHYRVDIIAFNDFLVVGTGSFGVGFFCNFGEAFRAGFDHMQILDQRIHGAGFCAYATAPAGADNAYIDLFH